MIGSIGYSFAPCSELLNRKSSAYYVQICSRNDSEGLAEHFSPPRQQHVQKQEEGSWGAEAGGSQ